MIYYQYVESPVGKLLTAGNEQGLQHICFPARGNPCPPQPDWTADHPALEEVSRQLSLYFEEKLKQFSLKLCLHVSPFQKEVLTALEQVPYGDTVSYGELAKRIGKPRASRAVGQANAKNPVPIVIPCHRVIGSNGRLTGFGGGLAVKQALLELEQRGKNFGK
ncbi:MAG: methylated-DNA--[protein]-cysteine S-methyltransferase [Desulfobacterales bacterium]